MSVRIRRVTTTRAGGVSTPPFDTFNLGDHVGDDPAAVAENRARLAATLGLRAGRVVWMNQVHGDRVEVVDGAREAAVDDTDALVTRTARLALAVVTADCVPVLMADARAGVAAAVHAGRVGAQRGVVARTVEAMLALGAQRRTSRCFWARRSAAATTKCPRRWPTRSRRRCRQPYHHRRRNPRAGSAGRNRLPAKDLGVRQSTSIRDARWPTRLVQSSAGCADRPAGLTGLDGVTAMAVELPPDRSGNRN